MSFAIKQLMSRGYFAPAGDDGADGGGGSADEPDRGDNLPGDSMGDDRGDELETPAEVPPEEKDESLETPEEEAERVAAEAAAKAADDAKARIRIPKARFDEAQNKAKAREAALLAQIEKLQAVVAPPAPAADPNDVMNNMRVQIDELQEQYEDLLLDGKKEEARAARRQIEEWREQMLGYQSDVKADAARRATMTEMGYNSQLDVIEASYPMLNPEHESFDQAKTDEVAALMSAFLKSGQDRVQALQRAVHYALGTKPAAPPPATNQRAVDARRKAAEANGKQPPSSSGIGTDSNKLGGKGGDIDVMRLGQQAFATLDDETKARMRGDVL